MRQLKGRRKDKVVTRDRRIGNRALSYRADNVTRRGFLIELRNAVCHRPRRKR